MVQLLANLLLYGKEDRIRCQEICLSVMAQTLVYEWPKTCSHLLMYVFSLVKEGNDPYPNNSTRLFEDGIKW